MTCAHVLGLIDVGPFADFPRAHLEAAWQHARHCATCGPALETANLLTAALTALPQPGPSPDLTAAVLARIGRIEQAHDASVAAMPATAVPSGTPYWSAGATALGGLAAGLAIVVSTASGGGTLIDVASAMLGGKPAGLLAVPSSATSALVLAAGLGLYAAGLFAPVGGRGSR